MKLIALVARDEDGRAVFVGAWDEGTLDIMGADEIDAIFAKAKAGWFPDGHEWREIPIEVDEDALLAHFAGPVVQGAVGDVA